MFSSAETRRADLTSDCWITRLAVPVAVAIVFVNPKPGNTKRVVGWWRDSEIQEFPRANVISRIVDDANNGRTVTRIQMMHAGIANILTAILGQIDDQQDISRGANLLLPFSYLHLLTKRTLERIQKHFLFHGKISVRKNG
jgi:hypothetical protein